MDYFGKIANMFYKMGYVKVIALKKPGFNDNKKINYAEQVAFNKQSKYSQKKLLTNDHKWIKNKVLHKEKEMEQVKNEGFKS